MCRDNVPARRKRRDTIPEDGFYRSSRRNENSPGHGGLEPGGRLGSGSHAVRSEVRYRRDDQYDDNRPTKKCGVYTHKQFLRVGIDVLRFYKVSTSDGAEAVEL